MSKKYDIKKLSGILNIKLDEDTYMVGTLMNEFAKPESKIKSLDFHFKFFDDNYKELPLDEVDKIYGQVAIEEKVIKVISDSAISNSKTIYTLEAPNKKHFTILDLENVVAYVESRARPTSEWFGGIDVHHIFFEGFHKENDSYVMYWGS